MDLEPPESDMAVLGEKRTSAECDDGGCVIGRKRMKNGVGNEDEMRRIAEIVLVLSGMGAMRGGKDPTGVEKEMMSEARKKVVSICEGLAPKDIMPREVVGGIIEDLGLNRLREPQRSGVRPPKLSIVQKMEISKRTMAKTKSFTPQAVVDLTQPAPGAAQTAGRPLPSDKGGHAPISAGSFQHSSSMGYVSSATSTILSFQPNSSQVSSHAVSTRNMERDSTTARDEKPHIRSDGRIRIPPVPVGNVVKTTIAVQPQSIPLGNISTKIKHQDHLSRKIEGNANLLAPQGTPQATHNLARNQGVTLPGAPPSMHHPIQGMQYAQAATLMTHHPEISKIVQKILLPKPAECPSWTPPSRDYMSNSLTCQMCKFINNEVDNMLVCDACEKGFHLKCLHSCNKKFVLRGEWYCPRCMTISGGKAFPPKYGRVTRNMFTTKITCSSDVVHSLPEKKVESQGQTANEQKTITNAKADEISAPLEGTVVKSTEVKTVQKNEAHEMSEVSAVTNSPVTNSEEAPSSKSCPDDKQLLMGVSSVSLSDGSLENTPTLDVLKSEASQCEEDKDKTVHTVCPFDGPPGFGTPIHLEVSDSHIKFDHVGAVNSIGVLPEQKINSNQSNNYPEEYDGKGTDENNPACKFRQNDQDTGQEKQIMATGVGFELQDSAKSSELHKVDWIGDVHAVDNKKFYQSFCMDGLVYKLQDYALIQSSNGKLLPIKLQAMWEDSGTGSGWVSVNRCYFPDDLPATVGRPSAPEGNEVYESNDENTMMVELIKGPCDVLPTKIFGELNQKSDEESKNNRPIFSCRWFYDQLKGVFCPIPR